MRKTQRSVSLASGGIPPYLDKSKACEKDGLKPRELLQRKVSDLNNNPSLATDKETSSASNHSLHQCDSNTQTHKTSQTLVPPLNSPKKYFSSTKSIKTERSKSTGDNGDLLYQFYPNSRKSHLRRDYCEAWHHNHATYNEFKIQPQLPKLEESIRENINIKEEQSVIMKERFEESSAYYSSSSEMSRPSKNYKSSYVQLYEKHQNNPHFSFIPPKTSTSSCGTSSGNSTHSSHFHSPFSSNSVFSSAAASSTTLASTSTITQYPTTEAEDDISSWMGSEMSICDYDLVDEFFLFPYDVLDADFDTICDELARYSPDIEKCLQKSERLGHLKAAKASDEWNTLWIYRGMNFKHISTFLSLWFLSVELYIYLLCLIKSSLI